MYPYQRYKMSWKKIFFLFNKSQINFEGKRNAMYP